jgi:hypothetical protein
VGYNNREIAVEESRAQIAPSLDIVAAGGNTLNTSPGVVLPPPQTASSMTSAELLDDTDDDMKPARGFVTAILFSALIWGASIGVLIWLFRR